MLVVAIATTKSLYYALVEIGLERDARMAIVDVKTEITGTVWKIVAAVGATLTEEEPILILESMKMEIPVSASESGKLLEILVKEGDTVTEGSVVARIEA
jgi:acetyl-CoA carboxylase biotin carboxyl carrier protein